MGNQIQSRATGANALTDDNSQLWYGTISVGTPAKTFTGKLSCTHFQRTRVPFFLTVDFDTGSRYVSVVKYSYTA